MGQTAKRLGYADSTSYFDAGRFGDLPDSELKYACRKAAETSGLQGVYLIRDKEGRNNIPVVFLCEADTEEQAREIHRNIWNLNLVPFVVVETPTRIRVYQGFNYDAEARDDLSFTDAALTNAAEILERLAAFRASAIDSGQVFESWGHKVTPKGRVDEHLLGQLKILDGRLRQLGLPRDPSHCLIGKYVWLSYLRGRKILSPWRLDRAGVEEADVFSRNAKLTAFHQLDDYLQNWLNGKIFPLQGEDRKAVKSEHLQKVAGVFAGEDPEGQMDLFPRLYDFSYVPIETLSVVYEQFLHHKEEGDETSEGEDSGAYYTPVCLADFMIEEMDRKLPLRDGVAVFDPSCGSGNFLVQAYRRLVERTMHVQKRTLKLTELRDLLEDNIFGVDRDPDACRVARMSLAIALLDYADPPDVSGPTANFKLPTLSENNVLQKDFFELEPSWPRAKDKQPPQWIIGNPPWVELKSGKRAESKKDAPAWAWFDENKEKKAEALPVSGNQVAEAFVWRVQEFVRPESVIGLVLPAMTLFKHEAQKFRQAFFSRTDVWSVANFSNLAYVLFAGADRPAACFFFRPDKSTSPQPIATFAPFVVEQTANLPNKQGGQLDTWNILVRAHDWREINPKEAEEGRRLTWKMAMWGSHRDSFLLKKYSRFPAFGLWRKNSQIILAAGPELRKGPGKGLTFEQKLIDKRSVSFKKMRGEEKFFSIPKACLSEPIPKELAYLRRGREEAMQVCAPPHLLINKGRRFAVFSDDFLIIPPGENALHCKNADLLKALGLYFISSAAKWHQFFISSEWGISTSIARLDDLEALPIPFSHDDKDSIERLARLYDALVEDEFQVFSKKQELIAQTESIIWKLLNFRPHERDLIEGFFEGAYQCIKGKYPADAVNPADTADIKKYCRTLRRELDNYLEGQGIRHHITVTVGDKQVSLAVEGKRSKTAIDPTIEQSSDKQAGLLASIGNRLRQKHSQHAYFEKSLFFYDRGRMLFLKPRRRIEWNVRQALLDADDLIAELVSEHD